MFTGFIGADRVMGLLTAPPSSTISETCRVQIGFSLVTMFSFLSVFSGGHTASATQGLVKAACLFREGEKPWRSWWKKKWTSYRREQSLSIWENQEFQSGKYKTLDFFRRSIFPTRWVPSEAAQAASPAV